METNRICELCNVVVHRASMQKHLKSKKHSEKEKKEMIIPEGFFKKERAPIRKKVKKVYAPKTLNHLT